MIFLNSKMKQFYENKRPIALSDRLNKLINNGVIIDQEFYLFKSFHTENEIIDKQWVEKIYTDEVGFECAVNKFHLEDYYDNNFINFEQVANISFMFASRFQDYWIANFRVPCTLIIGIDLDSEFSPDAVIRFHKTRENQYWLDIKEIENFSQAIMVIEVGSDMVNIN